MMRGVFGSWRWVSVFTLSVLSLTVFSGEVSAQERESKTLLIVAAEGLNGTALGQFIQHKRDRGFTVTLNSVRSGTTKDSIKSWISSQYSGGGTSGDASWYLLIVGDSDGVGVSTSTEIPTFNGGGTMGAPTDLPYGCLDGTSDWVPEMAIGRFAVDTESELQAIVDKTIHVESGVFSDPDYTKRAAFLAGDDANAGAEAVHDWVMSTYLDPAGYTGIEIYTDYGHDTSDITAALNNGTLWLTYFGHSGFTGWWDPAFNVSHVNALTNSGLYGVVLGLTCGSGNFDNTYSESLGEAFIRGADKGAIAYIGASTLLPMSGAMWECERELEKYFFSSFFVDGTWEVGPAWQGALMKLYNDPAFGSSHPNVRDLFEMLNLQGDPSLMLPHEEPPTGDFDSDGDVDLADFAAFQVCFDGAASGGCETGNLAGGETIDIADYVEFNSLITGP